MEVRMEITFHLSGENVDDWSTEYGVPEEQVVQDMKVYMQTAAAAIPVWEDNPPRIDVR